MSDDSIKAEEPQATQPEPMPEPKPVAEEGTTQEPEASEDKPGPLPTSLGDKENKQEGSFKKPLDVKPQLSPEKTEEAKLAAKYGKLKPGGSDFLRKRLNKGVKYFDSGDYNMEKQSGKMKLRPGSGKPPGLAGNRLGMPLAAPSPLDTATGKTIPTPATIPHRKQSTEISKLAV
ncbi:cAMP-regulated phosphoprotein 19-like [Acanthaster planci]|uniref:cAMP-regulated phosphoprotein 19-like n=1 Tax=Acanthaster planci TaxID=133434 RepID=A0A8B7ZW26_ACAPL|nr:cAMP-regulated phosphoprotein 19-like [Acanthaster planci]XP_022107740.1 cAMP-regulated phosphoprotein 19-like [Acanthaster planci]